MIPPSERCESAAASGDCRDQPVSVMNVSTFAMYLDILDRMEDLLPCRQERRLKAVLNEARIHLLTLEPEELRAIWQEFR